MQPVEGIRFVHAAICTEVRAIEDAAARAESPDDLAALAQRVDFFSQVNRAHTDGEEAGLYPDLETKLRHVGAAYLHDHREDHALFADLAQRITAAREATAATRAGLLAAMRRQTIALTEHVLPHVHKEDTLITPLIAELFSPAEQGAQIGKMMAGFSPALMAKTLPWLVSSIEAEDRIAYLNMLKAVMPPERLTVACGWIRDGVAADVWSGITARVPGLG